MFCNLTYRMGSIIIWLMGFCNTIIGKREDLMRKIKMSFLILAAAASMNLMTGCGKAPADAGAGQETAAPETTVKEVELPQVLEAVKSAYGDNYIPSMDYDAQAMKDLFGIDESLYDAYFAQGPMISVNVDTLIGVQDKEGQADAVEQALQAYQKNLIENSMQYPMNMAKVNASAVVRYGNDVFFVMLGTPDMEAEEKGEEAALESAKENNQIGLDAIATCFQ